MWIEFNGNPTGRRVGDCAVRAVSVALGIDWEKAYSMDGEMVSELYELMEEAPDEKTKKEFQKFIQKIEMM